VLPFKRIRLMYYCKTCELSISEENVLTDRDGDPYSKDTKFWSICPYCLEPVEELDSDSI